MTPTVAASPVFKHSSLQLDNQAPKLSAQQRQIIHLLLPLPDFIWREPYQFTTTGRIIEGIGRQRNKAGYASVSRSLLRLEKAGFIEVMVPGCAQHGAALFYRLTDAARALGLYESEDALP